MGEVLLENHSEDNQMFLMQDLQIHFSVQAYKSAYREFLSLTAVVNKCQP